MDPLTMLAAFGPLAVDLGKSLISRFIQEGDYKPVNAEEYVKIRSFELDLFKAMNDAGGTNASYPWVEATVRMMRPTVALVVLGTWAYLKLTNGATESVDNFAAAVGFYLFGDRTLFHVKRSSVQ